MEFPSDLLYTVHDEWIRTEDDELVAGITDFAQDQLSDVVFVELPEVGEVYDAGDTIGVVESVKAASDIYMPLAGEIIAINEDLENTPEVVNEDPYGVGWFVRIKANDSDDLSEMMSAEAYSAHIESK